jgi:hypothetical protein
VSIIYEALKKTQKKRENINNIKIAIHKINHKEQWRRLKLLIIPMLILGGLMLAYTTFDQYRNTAKVTKARENLSLSGVFLTGQDKYAMINNQAYKVGDKIGDMAIVSIDINDVKLMDANLGVTTLKVAL